MEMVTVFKHDGVAYTIRAGLQKATPTGYSYRVGIKPDDRLCDACLFPFECRERYLNREWLLRAAHCFFSDGEYAELSFEEFCNELLYDPESGKTKAAYKACKKRLADIERMGIAGDELLDILHALEHAIKDEIDKETKHGRNT